MCTTVCACACGQTSCACAPARHSKATAKVIPIPEVCRCTECGGAARIVEVTTPSGRPFRAQWCPRCDRATEGARRMRGKR